MKKMFIKGALLSLLFMISASVSAQIDLGSIMNSASGSKSSNANMASALTTIFSSNKQANSETIIGTWSYSEPAIVFTSNNVLTQAASKIAAQQIESRLQAQLNNYGVKKGAMSIAFAKNGSFTEKIKGKTLTGTWKMNNSKLQLTYAGVETILITTQINSGKLQMVTDATKLLTLFKTVANASGNANAKTIVSLMSSVKGLEAGVTLIKK